MTGSLAGPSIRILFSISLSAHQRCFHRNSRLLQCIYDSWRSRDEKQLYASLSLLVRRERSISLFDLSREIRMEGRLPCCLLCCVRRGACRLSGVCARFSSNRGRELRRFTHHLHARNDRLAIKTFLFVRLPLFGSARMPLLLAKEPAQHGACCGCHRELATDFNKQTKLHAQVIKCTIDDAATRWLATVVAANSV
ncbi:hypothetical protein ABIB73_005273 [Bradyrhizobium sp. F1.4.3]